MTTTLRGAVMDGGWSSERERAVALLGLAVALGDADELVVLPPQVARDLGVDVLDQRAQRHGRRALLLVHDLVDLGEELGLELLVLAGREDPAALEEAREAAQGIALFPQLDLALLAVARGVVGARVPEPAVG